jgi:2-phospho-L-lactate guanylyltransferase (CobY/MobA/RfbA family)
VQDLAIVVPLKEFVRAKTRLRDGGVADVDDKIRELAIHVFEACRPRPLFVCCESDDVEDFARTHLTRPLRSSSTSLNEAVALAYQQLSREYERIMIVHADLRRPEGLGTFAPLPGITIFSDHHGIGTNVLALPTGLDFTFGFGPGSADVHRREAERIGARYRMVRDSPWRFDVDEPSDLFD